MAAQAWLATGDDDALKERVAATWDGVNAYGNCDRRTMLLAIKEYLPELLPMFLYVYGGPRRFVWGSRRSGDNAWTDFNVYNGTNTGCVLSTLGYCAAAVSVMGSVRTAFPNVHMLSIMDDSTFLGPNLTETLAALEMHGRLMHSVVRVPTNKKKTYVAGAVDITAPGVVPATANATAAIGFVAVGTPVGPPAFRAQHISKRLTETRLQLTRLHLLDLPQVAVRMVAASIAPRHRFIASTTAGDFAAVPEVSAALRQHESCIRAAVDACHERPLPARAYRPVSGGGIGITMVADTATHAYSYLSCVLRVFVTLLAAFPDLAKLLTAPGSAFLRAANAAGAALPAAARSGQQQFPALFYLPTLKAQELASARSKAMQRFWQDELADSLATDGERMALQLALADGCVGGLFTTVWPSTPANTFSKADWNTAIFSYLGAIPQGLEALDCPADPLVRSALTRATGARIATHDLVKEALMAISEDVPLTTEEERTGMFGRYQRQAEESDDEDGDVAGAGYSPGDGSGRRIDVVSTDYSTGRRWLIDVTTPCGVTTQRLQRWLNGGRLDAHVTAAAKRKLAKYPLNELVNPHLGAGWDVVPFVVGMDGEMGEHALTLLASWTMLALPPELGEDPKRLKQRRAERLWRWRVQLGLALTRGKIAQYVKAREHAYCNNIGPRGSLAGARAG